MKIFQNAKHRLFLFHKKILEEKKIGLLGPIFIVLWIISVFWKTIASARWNFSKIKSFRPFKVKAIVVSVGNIVVGGTGKTPLVIKLIDELSDFQKKIGVISRGYGANQRTIPNEINANTHWKLIGDEPKCILNTFRDVALFIGKNRKKSAIKAIKKGKNLLILDDGMQQKKLHSNLKIIAVNATDLFGKGYFLPLGYLKDHPKRLSSADLIVINHCETKKEYDAAKSKIKKFSKAPIVGVRTVFSEAIDLNGKKISLKNQKVGAFCSIANPKSFIKLLNDLNCDIVNSKFFNDHEEILDKSMSSFENKCCQKGIKYLICTEKDIVKVNHLRTNLPIVVVKIELKICFEKGNWDNLIEKIHLSMNNLPVIFKRN